MTHVTSRLLRSLGAIAATALLALPALAEQPEDAWITTKVKSALLTDDVVNGLDVDVDTFDGHVTLHGRVDSEAERAKAEELARAIDGVAGIRNLLAVVPPTEAEATEVLDDALREAVASALENDRALQESDVEVKSVNDGVVVLAGETKTLSAHRRAIARARGVKGVRQVASEIRSPDRLADEEIWQAEGQMPDATSNAASDAWITTKVKLSLLTDSEISPARVNVDTDAGVVTLFGTVDQQADKDRAGEAARKIDGVLSVENLLQVVPDVAADAVAENDDALTEAVRKRIEARPALSDASISIQTENGVVRLTGKVASRSDQLTALTIARGTSGVKSVIDGLELKPAGG
jgi:osmotically-inducible protein OsmY